MMKKKEAAEMSRRDFFRGAGLGAGALGAAAVGISASRVQAAAPAEGATKGAGYRETDHVKKYYETARF
jgi:hypothetical protein